MERSHRRRKVQTREEVVGGGGGHNRVYKDIRHKGGKKKGNATCVGSDDNVFVRAFV